MATRDRPARAARNAAITIVVAFLATAVLIIKLLAWLATDT